MISGIPVFGEDLNDGCLLKSLVVPRHELLLRRGIAKIVANVLGRVCPTEVATRQ